MGGGVERKGTERYVCERERLASSGRSLTSVL